MNTQHLNNTVRNFPLLPSPPQIHSDVLITGIIRRVSEDATDMRLLEDNCRKNSSSILDGYVSAFDANIRQSFVLNKSPRALPMVEKTLPIICCHPLVSMYMPTTRARQRNSENLLSRMKRWQIWIKKFYCIFTRVEKKENFDKKISKNFPKIFQFFFQ